MIGLLHVKLVTESGKRDGSKCKLLFSSWLHFIQETKGRRHQIHTSRKYDVQTPTANLTLLCVASTSATMQVNAICNLKY